MVLRKPFSLLYMQEEKPFFILTGIDPGTSKLGIANLKVDIETLEILAADAETYDVTKIVNDKSWLATLHSYRTARIYKLKELLLRNFNKLQPSVIACESPFFNKRFPGAFQPLVEVLTGIKDSVIDYSIWQPLFMIDPSSVKNGVKAPGNADKDKMKIAVCALIDLNYNGAVPLIELDEHSIDAIAVAYTQVKVMIRNNKEIPIRGNTK